uniref:LSM family member 14B n=1 Tax=Stegastes partitus TaxID=144197 RepID=A0A3B5AU53_9TELE
MPAYNQLAAGSLLNSQYAAALGFGKSMMFGFALHAGPVLPGLHVLRGPMVEKAVQTLHVDRSRQRRGVTAFRTQEQQWDRGRPQRTSGGSSQIRRGTGQNCENRPAPRRKQGARRCWNRSRGQLMVDNGPSPILKFDTDFDFDSSNAQFNKEELEREVTIILDQNATTTKQSLSLTTSHLTAGSGNGDNFLSSSFKQFFHSFCNVELSWAEERKRNLETFGVPGRFLRGQGFRGGYTGRRGQGAAQTLAPHRNRGGQL